MNPPPLARSSYYSPSAFHWPLVVVAVTLLAACQGDAPFACGTIPAQELYARQVAHLEPCFEDPDGGKLTLSATSSAPGIASVRVSGLTIAIKGESVGKATITVTASDPDGLTASMDIAVLVPKPTDVGQPLSWLMTFPGIKLRVSVYKIFKHTDGLVLTYSASSANPAIATAEIVDSVYLLVRGQAPGSAWVTVTATAQGGLTAKWDVDVEVVEPHMSIPQ